MDNIQNKVQYCCVSKGNRVLCAYSIGNLEIDNLASLCLEKAPSFHKWYFETIGRRTYGFLMEDGCVYFAMVDEGLGSQRVLQFLEHVRDEFKTLAGKGSRLSFSNTYSMCIQEQLVPVVRRLITSLENVTQGGNTWTDGTISSVNAGLSPSTSNRTEQTEIPISTRAPLLGKSSRQDRKKEKDHMITMRDIELDGHRKSADRASKIGSPSLDSNGSNGSTSSISKDLSSLRRSSSQTIRKKWWRQVRIVLAVDAIVCIILFAIWLYICRGISCLQ